MTPTHPHPEWKRLSAEVQPLLTNTSHFDYATLSVLAGVDIRTTRGRTQFAKFRKFALSEWGVWFECEYGIGYRITGASEHPTCAMERVRRGRRQLKRGLAIAVKTNDSGASAAVLAAKRQIAASIGAILQASEEQTKQIRPLLAAVGNPGMTIKALMEAAACSHSTPLS